LWIRIVFAFGLAGSALYAQPARFSITPLTGYVWTTPIFDYDEEYANVNLPNTTERHQQRLSVRAAQTFGASIEFRAGGGWVFYGSGTSTPTKFDYVESVEFLPDFGSQSLRAWKRAKIGTWEAGAGRIFRISDTFPELRATLGAGAYRFVLDRAPRYCPPPTSGFVCSGPDPWDDRYNVASLIGGVVIRKPLVSHVALQLGVKASIGKANTEGFYQDLSPEFDQYEAPKSKYVRTTQLSLGLSLF
jgi:hypothetical protein